MFLGVDASVSLSNAAMSVTEGPAGRGGGAGGLTHPLANQACDNDPVVVVAVFVDDANGARGSSHRLANPMHAPFAIAAWVCISRLCSASVLGWAMSRKYARVLSHKTNGTVAKELAMVWVLLQRRTDEDIQCYYISCTQVNQSWTLQRALQKPPQSSPDDT